MINGFRHIAAIAVLSLAAFAALSCSGGEGNGSRHKVTITGGQTVDGTTTVVDYPAAKVSLSVMSDSRWDISVDYEGAEEWCTPARTSGSGVSTVGITVDDNYGEERSAVFTVDFGGDKISVRLTQRAYRDPASEVGYWNELPAFDRGGVENLRVVTHYVPGEVDMRNFTVCYDIENHYALWVAYPMHRSYYPSGSRTDEWDYDPKIPHEFQPNLQNTIRGYTRGHMLPSASRYINREANEQTFYFTNITCQSSGFNSGETAWTDLESRERGWGGTGRDTLFSVAGAVVRTVGGSESLIYAYARNDDKRMAVPNYFYKAMVKQFEEADGTHYYRGIAFWFRHATAERDVEASDTISIEELEQKTGIDFFPNLPDDVEERVEAERDPALWGLS